MSQTPVIGSVNNFEMAPLLKKSCGDVKRGLGKRVNFVMSLPQRGSFEYGTTRCSFYNLCTFFIYFLSSYSLVYSASSLYLVVVQVVHLTGLLPGGHPTGHSLEHLGTYRPDCNLPLWMVG